MGRPKISLPPETLNGVRADLGKLTLTAIMQKYGISKRSVTSIADAAGLSAAVTKLRWLASEDSMVAGDMPDQQIADLTGRSLSAIRCRRYALKQNREGL